MFPERDMPPHGSIQITVGHTPCSSMGNTACARVCFFRVATTQGKQGIWFLLFPGKNLLTQGKYLDCDYLHKKYVEFFKFQ